MRFKSDWRLQFAARAHTSSGAVVKDMRERVNLVEKSLSEIKSTGICFVADSDPLNFALSFFTVLDLGLNPVSLSYETPSAQRENFKIAYPQAAWVENGVVNKMGLPGGAELGGAYACLTSGTTSSPKLCVLKVEGALENARAHSASFEILSENRIIQALPVHHSFGLICYLWTSVVTGCSIDFNSMAPSLNILAARSNENDVAYLSPAQLRFFARMKNPPIPKLGTVSIGGGAITSEEAVMFASLFPNSKRLVSYGLTEAGPRVTTGIAKTESSVGSYIGRALKGVTLFVKAENRLETSGEGLLCVRSASLKTNLEAGEIAQTGVLLTRDHVRLEHGDVYFLAREQDIIKSGGVSIYPSDIESAARKCAGITDCIVLRVEDKLYEEIAVLAAEGSATEDDLIEHLNRSLLPSQMPKQIFVLPELPRQSLNKVDRRSLLIRLGFE